MKVITFNDIIPFLPVRLSDFQNNPVEELWIGPQNKISKSDIELFKIQNDYRKMKVIYSNTSY